MTNESDPCLEGGCQCGAIRYRITGSPVMAALCHCSMCRRANAAPAVAWAMYEQSQVSFLADEPTRYESSPGAVRSFCARCGTQISFTADYIPGLIDITIGSLDDPEQVAPTFHYWESRRLRWVQFADALPRHAEFPPIE
ncbi:GFA family protein [Variovorax sp. J22P240]|uniref:GFA family protein n=1 Tax=Variovorax sp. J22P240 TaxID=3053514 RepID=UPI0025759BE7|nr:GFA family protein [Variovorax sp. J22P240]MDL9998352.1 GFA family protein [Variovorax sp. J22P240]